MEWSALNYPTHFKIVVTSWFKWMYWGLSLVAGNDWGKVGQRYSRPNLRRLWVHPSWFLCSRPFRLQQRSWPSGFRLHPNRNIPVLLRPRYAQAVFPNKMGYGVVGVRQSEFTISIELALGFLGRNRSSAHLGKCPCWNCVFWGVVIHVCIGLC